MYQSTFAPKTKWTEEFAQGAEIRDYWQEVARNHDVYKYLHLKQEVIKAEWLQDEAKWKLEIKDLSEPGKVCGTVP